MDRLNYQHLLYFWMTAREGSLTKAAAVLRLSQPTLSNQIGKLEKALGCKLLERSGRGLVLTETGKVALEYADEIFSLGQEFVQTVASQAPRKTLHVGIVNAVPKVIVHRLLQPAFADWKGAGLTCREGSLENLAARLSLHELDVVISDVPLPPHMPFRAYSHRLGECGTSVLGHPELVAAHARRFPDLREAPLLMPTRGAALRREIDLWFSQRGERPRIVGEFDDSALLKVFAQQGLGLFFAPTAVEREICNQYALEPLGQIPEVREAWFALSIERRLKHPAVLNILARARDSLFR